MGTHSDGPKLSHINADEERREYKAKHCPPTGQAQAATYGRAPESWLKHSVCSAYPDFHPPSKPVHSCKWGDALWLTRPPHFRAAPAVIGKNRQRTVDNEIHELSKARSARCANYQSTRGQNERAWSTQTSLKHCLWHAGPACTWTHMSATQDTIWKVRKRITTSNDGRNATQSKYTGTHSSNDQGFSRARNHREKPGRLASFRGEEKYSTPRKPMAKVNGVTIPMRKK
jgi:hypothetical protein